ncbi:hypothetical protein Syun_002953 [Stephania yunnanensis]|uniref:Uncharacterized protein n=1 Tax=Stephania yunnanensis TaxID=152371 RepID=A0AAP0L0F1_9MAGN
MPLAPRKWYPHHPRVKTLLAMPRACSSDPTVKKTPRARQDIHELLSMSKMNLEMHATHILRSIASISEYTT